MVCIALLVDVRIETCTSVILLICLFGSDAEVAFVCLN